MTTENIITATWLPVFPGFYGTFFDGENMYEQEIDYIEEHVQPEALKQAMLDNMYNSNAGSKLWKDFIRSTARQCVKIIEAELKKLGFVESIVFEEISSLREYNFTNDSINIEVVFSAANLQAIRHFISEHFAQWKEYLKATYTSYDGFISHHGNQPGDEEWFVDNALLDRHNAGSVLKFLCGENGINSEMLYYACENDVTIDLEAYEKECIESGWYVPDTLWNRLKQKWNDKPRFIRRGGWVADQYVLITKKQTYIFAYSAAEVKNDELIVKRFFKKFIFARLKNEKGDKG